MIQKTNCTFSRAFRLLRKRRCMYEQLHYDWQTTLMRLSTAYTTRLVKVFVSIAGDVLWCTFDTWTCYSLICALKDYLGHIEKRKKAQWAFFCLLSLWRINGALHGVVFWRFKIALWPYVPGSNLRKEYTIKLITYQRNPYSPFAKSAVAYCAMKSVTVSFITRSKLCRVGKRLEQKVTSSMQTSIVEQRTDEVLAL